MEDTLIIGYDKGKTDIAVLTVVRMKNGCAYVTKSVTGEEAEQLYNELTKGEPKTNAYF